MSDPARPGDAMRTNRLPITIPSWSAPGCGETFADEAYVRIEPGMKGLTFVGRSQCDRAGGEAKHVGRPPPNIAAE